MNITNFFPKVSDEQKEMIIKELLRVSDDLHSIATSLKSIDNKMTELIESQYEEVENGQ